MTHHLKTWPTYFERVRTGHKRAEVRGEGDRTFSVGDRLVLQEFVPPTEQGSPQTLSGYTGRQCVVLITDILREQPWVPVGYAMLSFQLLTASD